VKVIFFGNHTVGVTALAALAETEDIVGVVAHPPDPEDGARYESVFEFATAHGWPAMRGKGKDLAVAAFVRRAAPDLIWITDYRYLLPGDILGLARKGAINLHPSLLPAYRGRAPINWAILEGNRSLGLTAHLVDEGMDTGDIVAQLSFELEETEDVGDALERLYPLYQRITRDVMSAFRNDRVTRTVQDEREAFSRPARTPADGVIDWTQAATRVRDLVRAVAHPYPGAYSHLEGQRVTVWKAWNAPPATPPGLPGEVVAFDDAGHPVVRCGDAALVLGHLDSHRPIRRGDRLGSGA
jgi:methionyl-tRNA formyltransferase